MKMEEILARLRELNIKYEIKNHIPVYTIEEMDRLGKDFFNGACICKNLFLRDQKGKRHFLYVLREDKTANLSELPDKIGSTRLSFASEERLKKHLNVEKGAVTPLAVLFDREKAVEVIIDKDLLKEDILGVHPGENTSTVLIKSQDLIKYIEANKNKIIYI